MDGLTENLLVLVAGLTLGSAGPLLLGSFNNALSAKVSIRRSPGSDVMVLELALKKPPMTRVELADCEVAVNYLPLVGGITKDEQGLGLDIAAQLKAAFAGHVLVAGDETRYEVAFKLSSNTGFSLCIRLRGRQRFAFIRGPRPSWTSSVVSIPNEMPSPPARGEPVSDEPDDENRECVDG